MLSVLGYFAVCLAVAVIGLQIQQTRRIRFAENKMAGLLHVSLSRTKLESMRDELLKLKAIAIKLDYPNMERFYEIEHDMNLLSVRLDQLERMLIECGLQQPSEKGRMEYMLKLVNMSIAIA